MTRKKNPSSVQEAVLQFIWRYLREHKRPPAYREIESAIGASSVSVVSHHVRRLEADGFLRRDHNVARGLSLTERALDRLEPLHDVGKAVATLVRLRIVGDIRAGAPVDVGNDTFDTYDRDDTIAIDLNLLPRQTDNLAALRVRGNSMIDALVQEGDIVVLGAGSDVANGDMVAAWLNLEQELTLKHFYREGARVRLQPANAAMAPIYTPADNVTVQGKVVLVVRPSAALRPG